MKKIFVAMVAAAMVLGGCTKGEMGNTNTNEMATVTFTADANTIDVRTRAGEGEAQTYAGVIGINYDVDAKAWEVAPQALGFENEELSATSSELDVVGDAAPNGTVQIKSTGAYNANFYSVAVAEGAVEVSAENTVALGGAEDATSLANDVIRASYATPVNGDAIVPFAFKHVMAKVRIEIYEKSRDEANKLTDGVEISNIENLGIVRNGSLNLLDGEVTAAAGEEATILSEAAINTEYFVLPQENVGLGKSFTVKYQDKDYTVTLTKDALDFNANKCRVISLLVTGSGITFTATLEDWADEVSEGDDFNLQ